MIFALQTSKLPTATIPKRESVGIPAPIKVSNRSSQTRLASSGDKKCGGVCWGDSAVLSFSESPLLFSRLLLAAILPLGTSLWKRPWTWLCLELARRDRYLKTILLRKPLESTLPWWESQ